MIVIDMDMPKDCRECPLRTKGNMSPLNYCMALLGRRLVNDIYNSKAHFCPIKCDIEDIKAEIEDYFAVEYEYYKDISPYKSLIFEIGHKVIDIIDRHCGNGYPFDPTKEGDAE